MPLLIIISLLVLLYVLLSSLLEFFLLTTAGVRVPRCLEGLIIILLRFPQRLGVAGIYVLVLLHIGLRNWRRGRVVVVLLVGVPI